MVSRYFEFGFSKAAIAMVSPCLDLRFKFDKAVIATVGRRLAFRIRLCLKSNTNDKLPY